MKRDLKDVREQRDKEREQRAALNKAKRTKEGKKDEIKELGKKVMEMKVEKQSFGYNIVVTSIKLGSR